jgi:hypothetical protein
VSRPDAGEHSLPATVNKYLFAAAGPCGRGDRGNFESAAPVKISVKLNMMFYRRLNGSFVLCRDAGS